MCTICKLIRNSWVKFTFHIQMSHLKTKLCLFFLNFKKIDAIPKQLQGIDKLIAFLKCPKAIGSELLYLKSMVTTKEKPLIIGFDGKGQPIPLNKVKKYSVDFQAFFRITTVSQQHLTNIQR